MAPLGPADTVLVHAAITRHRRLQQHRFISHRSEGWDCKVKVPTNLVPGEGSPFGYVITISSHGRKMGVEGTNKQAFCYFFL